MWAVLVEVDAPCGDQIAGLAQAVEQMLIEAFVRCPAGDCEAICREGRMRPLKLSTKPFCIGFPGAM